MGKWDDLLRGHPGVFSLHAIPLAHRTLATQKKPAYLGFQCLNHPPYSPDLFSPDYHLFPGLKEQLNFAIFLPTWRSLLQRISGWTDKLLIFFEWLVNISATG
jgi:hypothetical protein